MISNTTAQDSAIFLGVNLDDILSLNLQVGLNDKGPNNDKSMFVYRPVSKLNNVQIAKFIAYKFEPNRKSHFLLNNNFNNWASPSEVMEHPVHLSDWEC